MHLPAFSTVLGELIGNSTYSKDGLMPAGLYMEKEFYVSSNGTYEIPNVNGFVRIYNYLSTKRIVLFWASSGEIVKLTDLNTGPISLSFKDDSTTLVVSNIDTISRKIKIFYQYLKV